MKSRRRRFWIEKKFILKCSYGRFWFEKGRNITFVVQPEKLFETGCFYLWYLKYTKMNN